LRPSFRYLAIIEFFVDHPGEFDERLGYTLFEPDMGEYVALATAPGCGPVGFSAWTDATV